MLTLGQQDIWQCPRCGRGSPDIRDEAAHRDAHRRLERDRAVVKWEVLVHRLTRSRPEGGGRDRRRVPLLFSALGVVLLGSLLLAVRTADVLPGRSDTVTPATPAQAVVPGPPTAAAPSDSASASGEAPAVTPPPSTPRVSVEAVTPSSPPAVSTPLPAGATTPTTSPTEPADPPHLLELCLPPVICLAV